MSSDPVSQRNSNSADQYPAHLSGLSPVKPVASGSFVCHCLSVCLSQHLKPTQTVSLFSAFPGSLNIHTTFAHLLLVYPFPNKVTIFRMTAKQRFAIFRFHLNTCQFCSSLWQFGITMAVIPVCTQFKTEKGFI